MTGSAELGRFGDVKTSCIEALEQARSRARLILRSRLAVAGERPRRLLGWALSVLGRDASVLEAHHPHTTALFRHWIGSESGPALVLRLVVALLGLSFLLGTLHWAFAPAGLGRPNSVMDWTLHCLLTLTTVGGLVQSIFDYPASFRVLHAFTGLLSLVVPAVFLGAVVAKILTTSHSLIFSPRAYAYVHSSHGNVLAFSFYNSCRLPLAMVEYRVSMRVDETAEDGTNRVVNRKLWQGSFPTAKPYVPLRAIVRLDSESYRAITKTAASDTVVETTGSAITRIERLAGQDPKRIVIQVSGLAADMHSSFFEEYWYSKKDFLSGRFTQVEVDYDDVENAGGSRRGIDLASVVEWPGIAEFGTEDLPIVSWGAAPS